MTVCVDHFNQIWLLEVHFSRVLTDDLGKSVPNKPQQMLNEELGLSLCFCLLERLDYSDSGPFTLLLRIEHGWEDGRILADRWSQFAMAAITHRDAI